MLWESIKLALRSVRRNVLRSFLTLLGIVIGVAAVIALVTIGSGANLKISADIAKLGSNMLMVRPGQQGPGPPGASDARGFNERDVEALRSGVSDVRAIAPSASKQAGVVFDATSTDATITGADEAFFVGTAAEVTPITSIDHRPVGDGNVGEITKKLRDLYSKAVQGLLPEYQHWLTKV